MTTRITPSPPPEPAAPLYQVVEQAQVNGGTYVRAACGDHECELYWAADTRQPTDEDVREAVGNWASRL